VHRLGIDDNTSYPSSFSDVPSFITLFLLANDSFFHSQSTASETAFECRDSSRTHLLESRLLALAPGKSQAPCSRPAHVCASCVCSSPTGSRCVRLCTRPRRVADSVVGRASPLAGVKPVPTPTDRHHTTSARLQHESGVAEAVRAETVEKTRINYGVRAGGMRPEPNCSRATQGPQGHVDTHSPSPSLCSLVCVCRCRCPTSHRAAARVRSPPAPQPETSTAPTGETSEARGGILVDFGQELMIGSFLCVSVCSPASGVMRGCADDTSHPAPVVENCTVATNASCCSDIQHHQHSSMLLHHLGKEICSMFASRYTSMRLRKTCTSCCHVCVSIDQSVRISHHAVNSNSLDDDHRIWPSVPPV
jgi:hypothetical protein